MNDLDPEELHRVLSRSAAALVERVADDAPEAVLTRLCSAAVVNVPGVDHAGLTMRDRDGNLFSYGSADPLVAELDALQAELAEGPCVDAALPGTTTTVHVEDFVGETRWPRFSAAARDRGVRGLLSFAMAPVEESPGALNLYARTPRAFGEPARLMAGAFATQAAIALYGARRIDGLTDAVETRDVIGQAKGILMERFTIDDRAAFDLLVSLSQDSNRKLVDVARWLTAEAGTAAGRTAADPVPARRAGTGARRSAPKR